MIGPRPEVAVERLGAVLQVTIDRPHVRNAVDLATSRAVAAAMDLLDADDDLRVAVLSGAAGNFSSGLDLAAFVDHENPADTHRGFAGIVDRPPAKPVIAAVEGYALAGGFEIVLACDLVVAAADAVLGIPEVRRGLVAAGGGVVRLARRVPPAVAKLLALTGEPMTAARAHELGLVSVLAEPGAALRVALDLAATVAANAPLAVLAGKRLVDEAPGWAPELVSGEQAAIARPVLDSADAREGARAFLERRPPVWSGS